MKKYYIIKDYLRFIWKCAKGSYTHILFTPGLLNLSFYKFFLLLLIIYEFEFEKPQNNVHH
jgi:hypothetical protein